MRRRVSRDPLGFVILANAMPDVTTRSKWVFWSLILTVFLFSAVPSIVMVEKAKDYWRFLSGWNPGTLRQLKVRRVPSAAASGTDLDLHFVEFRLCAPHAKTVRLASSFNRWDPASLPLRRSEDGCWETAVPLPPGVYHYAFDVDGVWTPDPREGRKARHADRDVSVKQVP
jgi:hypothetical protein